MLAGGASAISTLLLEAAGLIPYSPMTVVHHALCPMVAPNVCTTFFSGSPGNVTVTITASWITAPPWNVTSGMLGCGAGNAMASPPAPAVVLEDVEPPAPVAAPVPFEAPVPVVVSARATGEMASSLPQPASANTAKKNEVT